MAKKDKETNLHLAEKNNNIFRSMTSKFSFLRDRWYKTISILLQTSTKVKTNGNADFATA